MLTDTTSAQLQACVQAMCKDIAANKLQFAFYAICYSLIVIGLGLRIDYIIEFNPIHNIFSDPQRHWEQGTDVLRYDPMSQTDPVFYQLFISVLAKLTLKIPALVAFYTILLSALTPWIWYRFLRLLQPSKKAALAGWAALSLVPNWISIYGYFMQETLLLPLLGAALYCTWRCKIKQTTASFVIMLLIWIAAGLTRGVAIPMAAVASIWLWSVQDKKIEKAAWGLVLFSITMGPLIYRSYQIMHIFAPHGVGHMNMIYAKSGARSIEMQYEREGARWGYIFQSPAAEAKPFEPFSDWQSGRTGRVYAYVNIDKGFEDWQTELDKHELSLSKYLWMTQDNFILLFFTESWPDSNRARWLGEVNYQLRWLWFVLGIVALGWSIAQRKHLKGQMLFPSLILAWFVVQVLLPISVNEGRYRMPFNGLIIAQLVLLAGLLASKSNTSENETPIATEQSHDNA